MSDSAEETWGLFKRASAGKPPEARRPDAEWTFRSADALGGTARVYLADSRYGLQRPVIMAAGFHAGPTDFDDLWHEVNGKKLAFADALHGRGRDLILLGYQDGSASILHNAETARACILRTIAERRGDSPLLVGGFGMGGLVTRYALAQLESQGIDHKTTAYLSFDVPHRGAWIPIGLQALAHFLTVVPAMSQQINSPAARQLLWRHIESVEDTPREDPLRTELLAELARVGGWPQRPRLLGVANGIATGVASRGAPPDAVALECTSGSFHMTKVYTQGSSTQTPVAFLKGPQHEHTVYAGGLPEIDGAPGGTLESFSIVADNLTIPPVSQAVAHVPDFCFVPSISAVSIRDISAESLYVKISDLSVEESDLDELICSSTSSSHSEMTPELGRWILGRLPR